MIVEFRPPKNASVFDICLNTYGTLDKLTKLLIDNNIDTLNNLANGDEVFLIDDEFIYDYAKYDLINSRKMLFCTGDKNINVFFNPINYLLIENTDILSAENGEDFII